MQAESVEHEQLVGFGRCKPKNPCARHLASRTAIITFAGLSHHKRGDQEGDYHAPRQLMQDDAARLPIGLPLKAENILEVGHAFLPPKPKSLRRIRSEQRIGQIALRDDRR